MILDETDQTVLRAGTDHSMTPRSRERQAGGATCIFKTTAAAAASSITCIAHKSASRRQPALPTTTLRGSVPSTVRRSVPHHPSCHVPYGPTCPYRTSYPTVRCITYHAVHRAMYHTTHRTRHRAVGPHRTANRVRYGAVCSVKHHTRKMRSTIEVAHFRY